MPRYNYTAKRKAAFRRAQLISARKRRGKGLKRGAIIGATGVAVAALAGSGAYYRHKRSGSSLSGPTARTATPMTSLVGVEIPATRAGMSFSRFKKSQGYSMHYTHRNSKGDRYLGGYRHKPLPKGAIKADVGVLKSKVTAKLFGRKLPSHANVTTEWQPNAAHPAELHTDIIDSYPGRTGRGKTPKRRWVSGALSEEGRGRRGSMMFSSITQRQAERKPLPEKEVVARVRDYQKQLRASGIIPNYPHLVYVAQQIRKQGF